MIVTVISKNQQLLDTTCQILTKDNSSPLFLSDTSDKHKVLPVEGDIWKVMSVVEEEKPDLLLFGGMVDDDSELHVLEQVASQFHNLYIVLLTSGMSSEKLMHVMRIGVREVLSASPTKEELIGMVSRFKERMYKTKLPTDHGEVLAFIPCKGGSGATFIATNLAYILAAQENKRVALIDLNLQLGDASLFLSDIKPPSSIADIADQIHRLDSTFLASSMLQILPNLDVLSSPYEPDQATKITPDHISKLIKILVENYDFVILDIGRRMDAVSIRALDKTDFIYPVLQQTLPFVRDAKRLIEALFSLGYSSDKIRLIINRYDKKSEITLDDVSDTLRLKVAASIPNNYLVVEQAVNHGVPVYKFARDSQVSQVLMGIGANICGNKLKKEKVGWFEKMISG